jgi:hypothetical protein
MRWASLAALTFACVTISFAAQTTPDTLPKDRVAKTEISKGNQGKQASPIQPTQTIQQAATQDTIGNQTGEDAKTQRRLVLFTGLLAAVGFLQVVALIWQGCLFLKTLGAMKHQAHEMKRQRIVMQGQFGAMENQLAEMGNQTNVLWKSVAATQESADAALSNAKAAIASERPWLLIEKDNIQEPHLNPIDTQPSGESHHSYCEFYVRNYGRTPARVLSEKAELQISNNPSKPNDPDVFNVDWSRKNIFMLPQGERIVAKAPVPPLGYVKSEELREIRSKQKFIWLCGYVRYSDTFDRNGIAEYETKFCYLWDSDVENPRPHWRLAGPPEYSTAT